MPPPEMPEHSNQHMPSAVAYRRTHQGEGYPANIIHQYIEEHGLPDAAGLSTLATLTKLPESTLRSSLSYYADYHADHSADHADCSGPCTKICNGTSCFLSNDNPPPASASSRYASCLGHCHQENNYLLEDSIHSTGELSEVSIQCLASDAVTTRRFLNSDNTEPAASSYAGFYRALECKPEDIIERIITSGLRGRGGAAFPTGKKWQACASTAADQRYIIANGNEGDAGSYVDRTLLERDPHSIIEGMLIGA